MSSGAAQVPAKPQVSAAGAAPRLSGPFGRACKHPPRVQPRSLRPRAPPPRPAPLLRLLPGGAAGRGAARWDRARPLPAGTGAPAAPRASFVPSGSERLLGAQLRGSGRPEGGFRPGRPGRSRLAEHAGARPSGLTNPPGIHRHFHERFCGGSWSGTGLFLSSSAHGWNGRRNSPSRCCATGAHGGVWKP